MIDRDTIAAGVHAHLRWLTDHTAAFAAGNGGATVLLGLTLPHVGPEYIAIAGAVASLFTIAANIGARYLSPIADAMGKAHAARWTPAPVAPGPERILVIEDDEGGQIIAAHAAEAIGAAVEHATTVRAALVALARDRGLRLVVLDLGLQGAGSSSTWAREVRDAAPPGARVLVVSGRDDASRVAETIGAAVLLKPVSIDTLADAMRAALPSR